MGMYFARYKALATDSCSSDSERLTTAEKMTERLLVERWVGALVMEAQSRDTSGHVQAVLAFNRYRLEGDGFMKAAEQHICPRAHSQRHTSLRAGIVALQGARLQIRGRSGDRP